MLQSEFSLEFSPDHFVDYAGVALDELDDLGGYAFVDVVGHGKAEVAVSVHLDGYVDGLQKRCLVDAGEDEVAFVKGFGTLGGGADAYGSNRFANGQEEARFLGKGAGVADHGEGVHLQVVVVVEAERLVGNHARIKFEATLLKAFA